ncbi:MAG: hypothetical protein R2813_11890 [Flavobacteriales bacterium]
MKNETMEALIDQSNGVSLQVSQSRPYNSVQLSIYEAIARLPFPLSNEDYDKVFSVLYREVGERSIDPLPELRCLTKLGLDEQLLKLGSKSDQALPRKLSLWKERQKPLDVSMSGVL